uniref:tumor necrosis factor ligand superfamily member 15-like n=1 Tax=Pristiophorus japonicus TaxID=55135 RepID=UPI00398EA4AE
MDVRGDESVAMVRQTDETRLQDARWKRTRLALLGCVSGLSLLTALSVFLLLQHVLAHKNETPRHEMIQQSPNPADKPRAHLTVKQTSSEYIDGECCALDWEDTNGLAFTKGELNYQKKSRSLIIPKKGDYFVYSQVSFRNHISKKCERIAHDVTKLTARYPEPIKLLSSTRSICEKQNQWTMAIYLGAVLHLDKGDRLVVNVSSIDHVDLTNDHKTYFGIFLL